MSDKRNHLAERAARARAAHQLISEARDNLLELMPIDDADAVIHRDTIELRAALDAVDRLSVRVLANIGLDLMHRILTNADHELVDHATTLPPTEETGV